MTALEFKLRFPGLEYMASMVAVFCQGPAELIQDKVRSADAADWAQLSDITMRLLSDEARELRLLGSYLVPLSEENPQEAERLEQFVAAIMPVRG